MLDQSLDLALETLRAHPNWYLFPIRRLEKFPPLVNDNLNVASNDPKQIRAWHARWRGCNWGVALAKSNLIVVDVDTKPGKIGQQTFDTLDLQFTFPDTFTVQSPSGGLHKYYNGVPGVRHVCALGKAGFGLDVDSPNYVLIAGCWLCTNSENGYEVVRELEVADAPRWFKNFLRDKETKASESNDPADAVVDVDQDANVKWVIDYLTNGAPRSIQGQGGDKTMFDVICVVKDRAISEQRAVELIDVFYNKAGKCEPEWLVGEGPDQDRLDIKVRNVYRYARENAVGSGTAEFAFGDPQDQVREDEVAALRSKWQAPGGLMDKFEPLLQAKRDRDRGTNAERGEVEDESGVVADPPPEDPPPSGGAPKPEVAVVDDTAFMGDDAPAGEPGLDDTAFMGADDDADEDGGEPGRKVVSLDEICARWVWVVGVERFVRIKDGLMWTRSQFDSRYNHYLDKGQSISANIFKTPGRIKRFERLAFKPGAPMIEGATFNVWRPSAIVPTPGDTRLWNEHLNFLFQNPADRDHVLNWMAWVYQNQDKKPNHALLIIGRNTGTGKSFIARVFEKLIGPHNTQRPNNDSLTGNFSEWVLNCKLAYIEELMQIGRREVANKLRDMITEPRVRWNEKNVPAALIDSYMAMIAISNHRDALPIEETDRRWLVVETNVVSREEAYYKRLFAILDQPEALAAIAHELASRRNLKCLDLGNDGKLKEREYTGAGRAPKTEARGEMIIMSRTDVETWLHDNKFNEPLKRNLVTVADIVEAMPPSLQKAARVSTVAIPNFLRDYMNGVKLGYKRLGDGRRVHMWAINRPDLVQQMGDIAAQYDKEKKGGKLSVEEQAARDAEAVQDFGAGED